jgi:glutathione S-transferase
MDTASATSALEVRRFLPVTPEAVFAAWTRAEALGDWFAPTADMTTIVHRLDARAGGSYRIEMRSPSGTRYIVHGTYTEFVAPHHLAFTWSWEGEDREESLVDLQLRSVDAGCELVLRHSRFASERSRDGHIEGWEASLGRLSAVFTT